MVTVRLRVRLCVMVMVSLSIMIRVSIRFHINIHDLCIRYLHQHYTCGWVSRGSVETLVMGVLITMFQGI